jgi:hypothetical protein
MDREELEGTAASMRQRIADLEANIQQHAGTLAGEPFVMVDAGLGMSCRVMTMQSGRQVISYGHDLLIGAAHYSMSDAKNAACWNPGLVPMDARQWKRERLRDLKATLELYEALMAEAK